MPIHDVSHELRGAHGRWSRGGHVIDRMVKEAGAGHERTLAKVSDIQPGGGKNIGGHWVDRPASEGGKYRVKLKTSDRGKRDVKVYDKPEDAAHAVHTGSHASPGSERAARASVGAKPSAEPPAAPRPSPGSSGLSPELRRMMAEAEARQKALTEEENRRRFPGGSYHENKFAGRGNPHPELAGGAAPPKTAGNPRSSAGHIDTKIRQVESQFAEEGIPYTPQDLVATRLDSVMADLKAGDSRITIKVPSGSEVTIPRDVAIELTNRVRNNQLKARQSNLRQMREFGY